MNTCMFLSCPREAVSQVFTDQPGPLKVCFTHERELIDRYGYEAVLPASLAFWAGRVEDAVRFLRDGGL